MPQNATEAYIVLLGADLRTNNGAGKIYWRESFQKSILNRFVLDIKKRYNDVIFSPNHVLVISYVGVPAYESNTITNTFQAVLASDGHTTYGIFNYQKTDSSGSVEFSETSCNYLQIATASNSSNLTTSSNVGRQGRHVFKLTNHECFPAIPIDFYTAQATLKDPYGTFNITKPKTSIQTNLQKYTEEQNSPIEHVFIQPIVKTNSSNGYMIICRDFFNVDYLLASANSRFVEDELKTNVMVVFKGTAQDSNLQYGSVSYSYVAASVKCVQIQFRVIMNSIPSLILSAHDTNGRVDTNLNFVYSWSRNITKYGAEVCAQAVNSFVEVENITLSYIAFASKIKTGNIITISGKTSVSREDNHDTSSSLSCKYVEFEEDFIQTPKVFVTAEELSEKNTFSNSHGKIYTWVQKVAKKGMTVCRSLGQRNTIKVAVNSLTINYVVNGQLDPCNFKVCPKYRQCMRVVEGSTTTAHCGCIQRCENTTENDVFCGTDDVTYKSICHMEQDFCRRFNGSSNVTIQYKGRCQSEYHLHFAELCGTFWLRLYFFFASVVLFSLRLCFFCSELSQRGQCENKKFAEWYDSVKFRWK